MTMTPFEMWNLIGLLLIIVGAGGLLAIHIPRLLSPLYASSTFNFNTLRYIQHGGAAELNEFRSAVVTIHRKRELLDAYTDEYFDELQQAGWTQLNDLLDNLDFAEKALDNLIASGDFDAAETLAKLLTDTLPNDELLPAKRRFRSVESLIGWQERASDLIIQLARVLELSASEAKELGLERSRREDPFSHLSGPA